MSSIFNGMEVPFQNPPPGLSRPFLRDMYLLVEPLAPLPDPPSRSTIQYSIKERSKLPPYEPPPGDEDFALVFSTGDTPPPSEAGPEEDFENAYFTRLEQKIKDFGRYFNSKAWMVHVPAMAEKLVKDATPGTFKHFLLLLLEPDETFAKAQHSVQTWLDERYSGRGVDNIPERGPYALWVAEKQLLLGEIELLRKLVEPLRDGGKTIYWLEKNHCRHLYTMRSLKKAYKIIIEFENETTTRTILNEEEDFSLSTLSGDFRLAVMSMRMARIDVCKESLLKLPPPTVPKFNDPTTSPASERRLHKCKNHQPRPDGTEHLDRPESSLSPQPHEDLLKYRLEAANCAGTMDDVIETMMNTARWLAKARCTESVDLFCDVARMFSPHDPPANLSNEKYSLLRVLCDAMFDTDDVGSEAPYVTDRYSEDDLDVTTNREYFVDAAASRRSLMRDLQLRMAAERPIAPTQMHGHRFSSHGSIRRGRRRARMLNKRARSEIALPRSIAHRYKFTLPADPSNWAANYTSPFGEAFQAELDRQEESRAYQCLKMICEEGLKARSRAVPSQTAPVQRAKESETDVKQKRRGLSARCSGNQASAMIIEALMKNGHGDAVSDAQEKENLIVPGRRTLRAKEQVDKSVSRRFIRPVPALVRFHKGIFFTFTLFL
ncbi:uncharacterized protein BDCG_01459 [Blastomyces dermatitidis ER-3]|uniref:Uncharacterized protein n=1 Tax=Ajellomyces dermatitidis (strain ER-3 / ATCC MYA-2586) TaxID=559297 RepID=A0ABX2VRL3_AJEDR|nr:uncharacterized protein BDCG_01459 [Blastomyces dermatitidis ER-3]OAS99872.1 hypothetical protein BDCG_01459 [Blastomyces dermatitidis ER-3]